MKKILKENKNEFITFLVDVSKKGIIISELKTQILPRITF